MLISREDFIKLMNEFVRKMNRTEQIYDKVEDLIGDYTVGELMANNFDCDYISLLTKVTNDTNEVIFKILETGPDFPVDLWVYDEGTSFSHVFDNWGDVYDFLSHKTLIY